jgi:hypothetical protein
MSKGLPLEFILFTEKLRRELLKVLSALHADLQKHTETIRTQFERARQDEAKRPSIQVFAELHTPEDVEKRRSANDDRQYRLQRSLTWGTWLAFGAAAIYGGVAYFQLQEMIGATGAAQQAIVEARRSRVEAEKSLNITIASFRLDQRAWVVPTDDKMHQNASGVYFDVIFTNTGKTPGIHLRGIMTGTSDSRQIPKSDRDPGGNGAMIAPGAQYHLSTSKTPLNETDLAKNRAGLPFNLYGTIWYDDIFHREHWVQFCDSTSGSLSDFGPCPKHNHSSDDAPSER